MDDKMIPFDYDFWRQHPDWFIEEHFGVKLFWWQKLFLRKLNKESYYYVILKKNIINKEKIE